MVRPGKILPDSCGVFNKWPVIVDGEHYPVAVNLHGRSVPHP
ncbi:hypothetical protein HMPREF9057_01377 [Actinomyces sp. oral taxon 171 str. F0337]|nr:hypothetical protein HMPREF9057_01377 [Actinomyces sp. oral taxon 171 str. F0337]